MTSKEEIEKILNERADAAEASIKSLSGLGVVSFSGRCYGEGSKFDREEYKTSVFSSARHLVEYTIIGHVPTEMSEYVRGLYKANPKMFVRMINEGICDFFDEEDILEYIKGEGVRKGTSTDEEILKVLKKQK